MTDNTQAKWYQLSKEEAFKALETKDSGLTSQEVKERLKNYGYNELKFKKKNPLLRFLLQFHNPLIYVLFASSLICILLIVLWQQHLWNEVVIILLVVVINTIIGFIQEGKAEGALEALKKMIVFECRVLREGRQTVIPARELVPGDIVLLKSGDKIPADLRLFYTKNLSCDESTLTGESTPVEKNAEVIERENLLVADQGCMVFSGTFISRGIGQGIVVATAEQTEFGKIAKLMKQTHRVITPLQRKLADFSRFLVYIILAIACLNFIFAVIFGYSPAFSFLASVALAVAAIPEMLPPLVTVLLALAATVMAKRKALIRRLPAAETLGCVTVICSDKTGTLTKNQMTVTRIYCGNKDYQITGAGYEPAGDFILRNNKIDPASESQELIETLRAGFFCNESTLAKSEQAYNILGDPTEGALIVSAAKAGIFKKNSRFDTIPFESSQQYMATLHEDEGQNIIYCKGSPERLLKMCQSRLVEGEVRELRVEEILTKADDMAGQALRVLAFGYKPASKEKKLLEPKDLEGLIFLGLQGMIDPPRQEAIEAVEKCKKAGIRPVMITGDHAKTAKAIAQQLGMDADRVLTGEELPRMSDAQLYEIVEKVSVYARVAPEDKFRIAVQLKKRGHIVAMTGDGVNDAPALKAADIGIAMGITGTEVSKEASDMVLADDNFATIVNAVEEGRHAWKNLEKAILYTLPTNGGQAFLIAGAILLAPFIPLFKLALPLLPIHILWVNMADSVFLTLPLIMEPKEKGLLKAPPRNPKEKIANRLFLIRVGQLSIIMSLVGFAIYYYFGKTALSNSVDWLRITQAQTATFMAVKLFHCGFLISARSVMKSVFTFNPFSNKWVLGGIILTIITQLMITYIPFLNSIFRTTPFPKEWWPLILPCFFPGLISLELGKFFWRRSKGKRLNPASK